MANQAKQVKKFTKLPGTVQCGVYSPPASNHNGQPVLRQHPVATIFKRVRKNMVFA